MKRVSLIILSIIVLLLSCGRKKKKTSLTGEEKIAVGDFIEFFQPLKLSFYYADSMMARKEKDSGSLINYTVFTQFVPDSLITRIYGKNVQPKIYALGKAEVPQAETFLFIKTVTADKKVIFILAFDKDKRYAAALPSLRPDQSRATFQAMTMDKKYSITKTLQRKNADGSTSEGKEVYAF